MTLEISNERAIWRPTDKGNGRGRGRESAAGGRGGEEEDARPNGEWAAERPPGDLSHGPAFSRSPSLARSLADPRTSNGRDVSQ